MGTVQRTLVEDSVWLVLPTYQPASAMIVAEQRMILAVRHETTLVYH